MSSGKVIMNNVLKGNCYGQFGVIILGIFPEIDENHEIPLDSQYTAGNGTGTSRIKILGEGLSLAQIAYNGLHSSGCATSARLIIPCEQRSEEDVGLPYSSVMRDVEESYPGDTAGFIATSYSCIRT